MAYFDESTYDKEVNVGQNGEPFHNLGTIKWNKFFNILLYTTRVQIISQINTSYFIFVISFMSISFSIAPIHVIVLSSITFQVSPSLSLHALSTLSLFLAL